MILREIARGKKIEWDALSRSPTETIYYITDSMNW